MLKLCSECGGKVSEKAPSCPNCGAPVVRKRRFLRWTIAAFAVILVFGFFAPPPQNASVNAAPGSRLSPTITAKDRAMQNIALEFAAEKVPPAQLLMDFTIDNRNPRAIKDVEIKCVHQAKSGTEIDSNTRTIYDIVPANSQKEFPKFPMGFIRQQVHTTSCQITDIALLPKG